MVSIITFFRKYGQFYFEWFVRNNRPLQPDEAFILRRNNHKKYSHYWNKYFPSPTQLQYLNNKSNWEVVVMRLQLQHQRKLMVVKFGLCCLEKDNMFQIMTYYFYRM